MSGMLALIGALLCWECLQHPHPRPVLMGQHPFSTCCYLWFYLEGRFSHHDALDSCLLYPSLRVSSGKFPWGGGGQDGRRAPAQVWGTSLNIGGRCVHP